MRYLRLKRSVQQPTKARPGEIVFYADETGALQTVEVEGEPAGVGNGGSQPLQRAYLRLTPFDIGQPGFTPFEIVAGVAGTLLVPVAGICNYVGGTSPYSAAGAAWQANHPYAANDAIVATDPVNGGDFIWLADVPGGTSGNSLPVFNTLASPVTDNDISWVESQPYSGSENDTDVQIYYDDPATTQGVLLTSSPQAFWAGTSPYSALLQSGPNLGQAVTDATGLPVTVALNPSGSPLVGGDSPLDVWVWYIAHDLSDLT